MVHASAMESFGVFGASSSIGDRADWQLIAKGGMADVFLAADGEGWAVLKQVRDDLEDPRLVGMLVAEAELTASFRHPNVVRCHGLSWGTEGPTMAMEHVAGLDLEGLLRACSKRRLVLPLSHRLAVVCAVLRALDHVHRSRDERGAPLEVVHRDVSPSNVLVGFEGEVKLCDFGIASSTRTPRGEEAPVEGKASYMSPEQARGEPLDARSDVFSAGILLWELIAGRRMRRRQDGERIELARRGHVPTLPQRGMAGEKALRAIVERALAVDPEERYDSAGRMMRDLERWARRHHHMVGESALRRFMRAHFSTQSRSEAPKVEEPATVKPAELLALPVAKAAQVEPQPDAAPPRNEARKLRPWWRDLPVLVAAAGVTFTVLSALF